MINLEEFKELATTSIAGVVGASPIALYLGMPIKQYLLVAGVGIGIIVSGLLIITALNLINDA